MRRTTLTTVALVLSLTAAAVGGWAVTGQGPAGAFAAAGKGGQILSRMVRDGSLTGKDLKDGSVGRRDLAASARAKDGVPGAAGAAGADGASVVGPQGIPGSAAARGDTGAVGPQGVSLTWLPFPAGGSDCAARAGLYVFALGTTPSAGNGAVCDGARGPQGEQGEPGADSTVPGPQGEQGEPGADSTVPGPQGEQGEPGQNGSVRAWASVGAAGPGQPLLGAHGAGVTAAARSSLGTYTVTMAAPAPAACVVSAQIGSDGIPFATVVPGLSTQVRLHALPSGAETDAAFSIICTP